MKTWNVFQPDVVSVYDCKEGGGWRNQQKNFTLGVLKTGGKMSVYQGL